MHIGFGSPGVWGAGGKGANAPDWLRAAYEGSPAGQTIASATTPSSPAASPSPAIQSPFGSMAPLPAAPQSPIPVEVAQYATAEDKQGNPLSKFLTSLETMPAAPLGRFPGGPSQAQANALSNVLNNPTVADLLMSKRMPRRA